MKRLLRFADSIGERSPWARMEVKKRAKWGALLVAESTAVSVVFGLLTHTTLAWSAIGAVWVIWNAGIVGLAVWPARALTVFTKALVGGFLLVTAGWLAFMAFAIATR